MPGNGFSHLARRQGFQQPRSQTADRGTVSSAFAGFVGVHHPGRGTSTKVWRRPPVRNQAAWAARSLSGRTNHRTSPQQHMALNWHSMTLGQEIWIPQRLAMAAVCVESAAVADCQYLAQQSIRQARGLGELYGLDLSPLVEAYEGEMKTAYEAYAALERMGRPLPCGQLRFLGNLLNGKREDYVGMSMHSGPNILGGGGPRLTDSMGASWTAMASSQARRGTTTPDLLTRCDNRCGVASRQMAFPSRPAPHANRNAAADFDGGHKLTRPHGFPPLTEENRSSRTRPLHSPTGFLHIRRKTAANHIAKPLDSGGAGTSGRR